MAAKHTVLFLSVFALVANKPQTTWIVLISKKKKFFFLWVKSGTGIPERWTIFFQVVKHGPSSFPIFITWLLILPSLIWRQWKRREHKVRFMSDHSALGFEVSPWLLLKFLWPSLVMWLWSSRKKVGTPTGYISREKTPSDTLMFKNQRMGQIAFCPPFLGFLIWKTCLALNTLDSVLLYDQIYWQNIEIRSI